MTEGIRLLAPARRLTDDELCQLADTRLRRLQPLMQLFTPNTLGDISVLTGRNATWEPIRNVAPYEAGKIPGIFNPLSVKIPTVDRPNEVWLYGIDQRGHWALVCLHLDPVAKRVTSVEMVPNPWGADVNAAMICEKVGTGPINLLMFTNKICSNFEERLQRKLRKVEAVTADFQVENKLIDMWRGISTSHRKSYNKAPALAGASFLLICKNTLGILVLEISYK